MNPLHASLAARIRAGGPISVEAFVEAALYDHDHGYYRTQGAIGAASDFITAPEVSQVFGEAMGAWIAATWQALAAADPVQLVEFGPGRGTLLADALRTLGRLRPDLVAALRLHLIETSPLLAAMQRRALADIALVAPPVWHERLDSVPAGPTIALANEFFDALPIRQFVRVGDGWRERRVGLAADGQALVFVAGPLAELPAGLADAAEGAAEDEIVETCPAGEELAAALASRLAAAGGAALVIDYGHARAAPGDTLQAVRGHRFATVLERPGETDLSHHVDFQALTAAAQGAGPQAAGVTTHGPIPQGLFLGRLGAGERAEALAAAATDPAQAQAIVGAVRRLLHPGRMGLLFKAFAIAGPGLGPLPGFAPSARGQRRE
ncbi:MAG TPA: SAM-dependent methyltransferase [Candidatus Defluviicoccus seviourii]|nr:SAM-dependent methyltransferase [Candidatus Defluviicoccus seviourii]